MTRLPDQVSRNGLSLWVSRGELSYQGRRIHLSPGRIRLLRRLFFSHRVSVEDLMPELHHDASLQTCRVHMSMIRQALRDANVPLAIIHEKGLGYGLQWEKSDMKAVLVNFGRRFWPVLGLLAIGPALAQQTSTSAVTQWTVETVVDSAPVTRRTATSPASARTAAQAACGEYDVETKARCLAKLKALSLASLTATGPNVATYYLDLDPEGMIGRHTYVPIMAVRR